MSKPTYIWRSLTPDEKVNVVFERRAKNHPWHGPPHRAGFDTNTYHITAACYEHVPYIGYSPERMDKFAEALLAVCAPLTIVRAWCLLPNHYHLIVVAPNIFGLLGELGRLHGRTSYDWNGEEDARGRKVFYRAAECAMRSERHYYATLNYVHHNAVHHRYVRRWEEWPWGSAARFIEETGRLEAERIWREFPIKDYGRGWDDVEM